MSDNCCRGRYWEEDAKKNTQAVVAALLGVARETVSKWFVPIGKDTKGNNSKPVPDARVRVPFSARPVITERIDSLVQRK